MALLGKYELHETLGKGGFGTVYRATDTSLRRVVALKILHPPLAADADSVERFRREAQIVATLDHPGIVTIYELSESEGRFFIAMKYLPGGSLATRIVNGLLSFAQAAPILLQVCAGLQTAHAQGLVHRDIKPANILFDAAGQAVISDFGLARAFTVSGGASSSTGVAGTPFYRAPELWRGTSPASPAADVYSLGCVLVEMLTGLSPFRGDTPDQTLTRHLIDGPDFGPIWPPPGSPMGLAAVVAQALAKDPARRFANAATLANALQNLLRSPQAAPAPVAITPPVQSPSDLEVERLYQDGLSAFHLEDWARAQKGFQAALKLRPGYRDAVERLNQAQRQFDLAERYARAQDLFARSDWPGALAILEKLAAEAPGYRDAAQRLEYARQQSRLQALYADAIRHSQAGEWQAVVDTFTQITRLQVNYPDPQNLLPQARQQLAAQEHEQKLAALYGDALQALDNRRWKDAQRLLSQIVKIEPSYRDAPLLSEKVKAEIAYQKSCQGGSKLLVWLFAHSRGIAVVGLAFAGLVAVIFVWTKFTQPMSPVMTPSLTHSVVPSLTSAPALIASPSHTSTLPPSAMPSLTATLPPSRTPTITLPATRTLPFGMVLIPAGSFQMGNQDLQVALAECKKDRSDCSIDWYKDETPSRSVTLDEFLIDQYEVTNAKYAECVAAGKCQTPTDKTSYTRKDYYDNKQYANYPLVNISWNEADAYCKWLGARLPSEAEWEKAARGGLQGKLYPWGDPAPVCTVGADNGAQFYNCSVKDTVGVGSFKPNGYGLYDMAGNVWEWTTDWYGETYYQSSPNQNPTGPQSGTYRVVRGGSWSYDPVFLRTAYRYWYSPDDRDSNLGFRCARSQ